MELLIKDRIFFAKLLPECKNFLEFNLKRNLLKKIEITEADKEKYEISQQENCWIKFYSLKKIWASESLMLC